MRKRMDCQIASIVTATTVNVAICESVWIARNVGSGRFGAARVAICESVWIASDTEDGQSGSNVVAICESVWIARDSENPQSYWDVVAICESVWIASERRCLVPMGMASQYTKAYEALE